MKLKMLLLLLVFSVLTFAQAHSVALAWTYSGDSPVSYNIKRATATGGPYSQLSTVPSAATTYTDNISVGGVTFYYIVTAVNSSGVEFSTSNEFKAVIPSSVGTINLCPSAGSCVIK